MELSLFYIGIAFAAGLASFLSPCVLPLVPGYISLISGVSIDHLKSDEGSRSNARRAVITNSLAFNAGLSLIFVSLGAAAGWLGASITSNPWVRIIGGIVIILFGLQLIGVLKIGALYKDTRMFSNEKPRGALGSFTLGMAFAAGWTPCIGPILGTILGLAATTGGWQSGLTLSTFYALGLAVPFLITGLSINRFLGFYSNFRRHLHKVEVVSGVVLIIVGALIASGYATRLASSSLAAAMGNPEAWIERYARNRTGGASLEKPAQPALNNAAPVDDLEFKTLDGESFRLSSLRGRVVLLNFWATWCVPCRAEIPTLNAMHRDLEAQGLTVVGVNADDTMETVREFQNDLKQEYKSLIGGDEARAKFDSASGLPITYIIDREGRIRQTIRGARERDAFEAAIKPLLAETSPATTAARTQ
ncbi:MAG: redoxin domain-containing protein [Pyrinomonadaceae bacterium]|nr:redoxin domain-containing protein [Pyrinomonadaceae bacterium]